MLNSEILLSFLVIIVAWDNAASTIVESYYEETSSYSDNPHCKPSALDKGIQCSDIGPTIEVKGGHYLDYELHFVPLASAYYVARFADAWGYQRRCPTNTTLLKELDIQTPWTGTRATRRTTGLAEDRALALDELKKRGFNTDPSNLIEFDYLTTDCK